MKITGIHVCFEVASLSRALKFYSPLMEAAGFASAFGDGKTHCAWRNGPFTFAIGLSRPRRVIRKPPTGRETVVSDHTGFSVGSSKDVAAITAAMLKAGFKPLFAEQEYPEFGKGFYAVTFQDSDHNILEFCARPKSGK